MNIALVVITDGRQHCITETLRSIDENLHGDFASRFIIDDSGDSAYHEWLVKTYGSQYIVIHHAERRGLAAALRTAWTMALAGGVDYIWHAEDDMVYSTSVDVAELADLLEKHEGVAQISLKRQPVNAEEKAAGGFIELHPWDFHQRDGYVAHQTLFTFNPCLLPRRIAELAMREPGDGLERGITDTLLHRGYTFAILGSLDDAPRVTHIGDQRSAGWKP